MPEPLILHKEMDTLQTDRQHIAVIIPAQNEEKSISKVLAHIPRKLSPAIVVVDNASDDATGEVAEEAGATVIYEKRKGYGYACLAGMAYCEELHPKPDIIVFLDADYSDHPEEMEALVEPIIKGEADLVIGSRALGKRETGSMTPAQVFGNRLATFLLKHLYGAEFTDLGPFRAIRFDKLLELNMQDKTYGWTVEMQLKAAKQKLRSTEVPVNYRRRIGKSKISGTISGTLKAGYKILYTIFKYR
jgi:glycosyltransferase involved in cell wall biosynthesis